MYFNCLFNLVYVSFLYVIFAGHIYLFYSQLSHVVASGSEIMPCNKIDKPLVVYRFSGNVMTSIITLHYIMRKSYPFYARNEIMSYDK